MSGDHVYGGIDEMEAPRGADVYEDLRDLSIKYRQLAALVTGLANELSQVKQAVSDMRRPATDAGDMPTGDVPASVAALYAKTDLEFARAEKLATTLPAYMVGPAPASMLLRDEDEDAPPIARRPDGMERWFGEER